MHCNKTMVSLPPQTEKEENLMEKPEVFENALADDRRFVREWEYFEGDQKEKDAAFVSFFIPFPC